MKKLKAANIDLKKVKKVKIELEGFE